ncbi:MAG: hypothetical protein QFX34_01905 [Candidatus Verstraetearchaeota archaeon]|nr:hypothetical protein [Candidatus Verstraetearchaeota archaeon]
MIVYIKLDDIDLIKRRDEEGATVEIRSVHEIQVSARRKVIELPVPGSQSNIFQDMGRHPRCLRLEGRLIGRGAPDTLKTIRTKFNSGELIPFSSDLWAIEDITTVIFEGFSVRVHDGIPLEIRYTMLLREAKPPPEEGAGEKGAPSQKGEADKEVEEKTKEITKEKEKEKEGGGKEGEGGKEGGKEEEKGKEKTKEKEGAPEGKVGPENGAAEAAPKGGEEAGIKSGREGGGKAYTEKDEVMKGEEGKGPGEKEEVKGRGGESESGSLEDERGASESGGREGEKGAEKSGRAKSEESYADDKGGSAAPGEDGGFKGGLFEPASQDSTKEGPKKAPEKGN